MQCVWTKALMEKVAVVNLENTGRIRPKFAWPLYGNCNGFPCSVIPLFIEQLKANKCLDYYLIPKMTKIPDVINEAGLIFYVCFEHAIKAIWFVQKAPASYYRGSAVALKECLIWILKSNYHWHQGHGEEALKPFALERKMLKAKMIWVFL